MFYTKDELLEKGFLSVGNNTKVSKLASLYLSEGSSIGSNVRIDDFTIIKGNIEIENNVHISSFCSLNGTGSKITLRNYVGISTHCGLFTAIEDFIKPTLMSPAINKEFSKISRQSEIFFDEASKVGSNCTFLPGVNIGYGASIGANSVIFENIEDGAIVGPKHRGIKIYGFRDLEEIKQMQSNYEKNN